MSEERAQQNTDTTEEAPAVRRRRGRDELLEAPARGRERAALEEEEEPDVLLDVSELEVERISLEVEGLRAHVSVLAELASLLSLSVGVDARLDRVKLEIEGVEAQVLLKVRLEHVRAILEKALDTIGEHPEILRILTRSLSELVRESLGETLATLDEILEGLEVGETVDEVLKGRLEEIRATLEDILERQRAIEGETRGALGEVQEATPAAKRKAEELGVDLSVVEGTGSGGRITVRDVQSAAKAECGSPALGQGRLFTK